MMAGAGVQEVVGFRLRSSLYHVNDGFFYLFNTSKGQNIFLKCHRDVCTARASMPLLVPARIGISIHKPHNHGPDTTLLPLLVLKRAILERCRNEATDSRSIFDEECSRVPLEVSRQLGFEQMRSSMYKARREGTDTIPFTLGDLADKLELPRNEKFGKTIDGGQFYLGKVENAEGGVSVIFGSPTMIAMLEGAEELHVDGTFKVRPTLPPSRQILTIMAMHFNRAFPVFYVLMERKNIAAYKAVFNFVKSLVPALSPSLIVTDYEHGLQSTAQSVFSNSHLMGCWFHVADAMRRKARSLGLTGLLNENQTAKKVVRMAMALPLLPQANIATGFNRIEAFTNQNGLGELLQAFLNYVNSTWIQGVGAQHLSVFQQRKRTNNDQEAYHRILRSKFRQPHPNIWLFLDGLKKTEKAYVQKYALSTNIGADARPRRSAYIAQDERIARANRLFQEGAYNELEFLHNTAYAIGTLTSDVGGGEAAEPINQEDDVDVVQPPTPPAHLPERPADPVAVQQPRGRGRDRGQGRGRRQARGRGGRGRGRGGRGRGRGGRGRGGAAASPIVEIGHLVEDPPVAPHVAPPADMVLEHVGVVLTPNYIGPDLTNYRASRTVLQLRSMDNCPPQHFVNQQVAELRALLEVEQEGVMAAEEPYPVCILCMANRATRLATPCGHWAGCISCCIREVETSVYFLTNSGFEVTECRLPIRCSQCSSLVGGLIRVYH